MTLPLYRRLLGPKFDMLPARVRELHDLSAPATWHGRADVERGPSWVARAMATLLSFPAPGRDQPLSVSFTPDAGREIWTRRFGETVFPSLQYAQGDRLFERVGPSSLVFALDVSPDGLSLILSGVRFLGIPLPRMLHPDVRTLESERDGRYRFEVEATLPLIGLLVRYSGWLEKVS
jgi:hypothetical protein